jgi:hypothetical protein
VVDGTTEVRSPEVPTGDERVLRFDAVTLPLPDIGPPCPRPSAGTATLVHPKSEKNDAIVDFADPGDGFVTVTRDDRASEPTDFCAYKSELW